MYREKATLPTLGMVAVDFHKESEVVVNFMGRKEWNRLRNVPHLGVAASVFNGVHHSRLEYVLLQCAVTGLVAKLHRHDAQFALSSGVTLAGITGEISSGEELLKIWVLLSNFGHAQYTYGVERSLLQQAFDDSRVKTWLTEVIRPTDLRNWALEVIEGYRYPEFRYVLSLRRIWSLPSRDRRRNRFSHYLRNLLLPLSVLFPKAPSTRHKLGRLRELFARIRLLSMVALDAHYSHHPININLNSAIIGLADLVPSAMKQSGFDQMLRGAAGWLADELYLHPSAVAAQKEYEVRFASHFPRRFTRARAGNRLPILLQKLMDHGIGAPRPERLRHLVRLTLRPRAQLLGRATHYEAAKTLGRDLVTRPHSYLSIDFNAYTSAVHLDLFTRLGSGKFVDVARVYTRLQRWLLRSLEAEAVARTRYFSKEGRQRAKEREVARQVERYESALHSIFDSIIATLLPETHRGVVLEFTPFLRRNTPVLVKFELSDGTVIDTATPRLTEILDSNPDAQPSERLQEIRCLKRVLAETNAKFILICCEKYVVRDQFGRDVDDWDGIQIAISDTKFSFTVVEGKTGGNARDREEDAFKQLADTRTLLRLRHSVRYRRRRIPRLGAQLEIYCDVPPTKSGPSP